jgi:ATP-dependent DNA helicase RecQ
VDLDITIDSQKVLSCVYRVKQLENVAVISKILRGEKSRDFTKKGYYNLSTYGIMKNKQDIYVRKVINHLVLHNYLTQSDDERSPLKLTRNSRGVLIGQTKVYIKMANPVDNKSKVKSKVSFNVDEKLFEKLKEVRQYVAQVRSIPSYIIFSDATLKDMCVKLPTTKDEFLKVNGVGEIKMEKYGESFMDVIRKFKAKTK